MTSSTKLGKKHSIPHWEGVPAYARVSAKSDLKDDRHHLKWEPSGRLTDVGTGALEKSQSFPSPNLRKSQTKKSRALSPDDGAKRWANAHAQSNFRPTFHESIDLHGPCETIDVNDSLPPTSRSLRTVRSPRSPEPNVDSVPLTSRSIRSPRLTDQNVNALCEVLPERVVFSGEESVAESCETFQCPEIELSLREEIQWALSTNEDTELKLNHITKQRIQQDREKASTLKQLDEVKLQLSSLDREKKHQANRLHQTEDRNQTLESTESDLRAQIDVLVKKVSAANRRYDESVTGKTSLEQQISRLNNEREENEERLCKVRKQGEECKRHFEMRLRQEEECSRQWEEKAAFAAHQLEQLEKTVAQSEEMSARKELEYSRKFAKDAEGDAEERETLLREAKHQVRVLKLKLARKEEQCAAQEDEIDSLEERCHRLEKQKEKPVRSGYTSPLRSGYSSPDYGGNLQVSPPRTPSPAVFVKADRALVANNAQEISPFRSPVRRTQLGPYGQFVDAEPESAKDTSPDAFATREAEHQLTVLTQEKKLITQALMKLPENSMGRNLEERNVKMKHLTRLQEINNQLLILRGTLKLAQQTAERQHLFNNSFRIPG